MTRLSALCRRGAVLTLAVLVAACSNAPHPKLSASPVLATDRSEIDAIAALLDQGDRGGAKKRIAAALKRDPGNASLMLLRDSIQRDPQELLGPTHFTYTVQPGDTIGGLAQRFLGNRLKSYQLARYNGIEGPTALRAGQVLRIPGQAPHVEPIKRPERRAEPQAAPVNPAPRAAVAPAPAARPPVTRPTANVAAARRARSAGLAALNEGNPSRAVGLLSHAAALDPGNAAIARDLQRAQRINATVQARQ
jgi:LysM repeat protein